MGACAFRPERPGEPSFRTATSPPRVRFRAVTATNTKAGTRAKDVPAGAARVFGCHDRGDAGRRALESARLLRAMGRQVKARAHDGGTGAAPGTQAAGSTSGSPPRPITATLRPSPRDGRREDACGSGPETWDEAHAGVGRR